MTNLVYVNDKATHLVDEGRAMDFSVAFKSISHSILLAAHGLNECSVLRVKNHLDSLAQTESVGEWSYFHLVTSHQWLSPGKKTK